MNRAMNSFYFHCGILIFDRFSRIRLFKSASSAICFSSSVFNALNRSSKLKSSSSSANQHTFRASIHNSSFELPQEERIYKSQVCPDSRHPDYASYGRYRNLLYVIITEFPVSPVYEMPLLRASIKSISFSLFLNLWLVLFRDRNHKQAGICVFRKSFVGRLTMQST